MSEKPMTDIAEAFRALNGTPVKESTIPNQAANYPRVIVRVMDDGLQTKDGAA